MRFLRYLFTTTLALGLFFVLSATAFAGDNYAVSGGAVAALPQVGDVASTPLTEIVLTDSGGDDFTQATENIVVTINTFNYNNVAFDNTVAAGALIISGSCGYNAANALTYSADRQQVTIPVINGVNCGAGEVINILGLKIVTRFGQLAPGGAVNLVLVDNNSTTPNAAVPSSSTIDLASLTDDAAASITLAAGNAVVAGSGTTTVAFTLGYPLAATDTVTFTMPAWIALTNGAIVVNSDGFGGAGTFTCSGNSGTRVLTCLVGGGAIDAGTSNFVLAAGSVTATYDSTNGTNAVTNLAINFMADGGTGEDVGTDATVNMTDTTVGALASTNVEPASLVVSATGTVTVTFTTVTSIPAAGVIKVTFPSGYNLTSFGTSQTPGSASGITAANWSATRSGQVVTLTENASGATTAGVKTFTLANIMNPDGSGSTGTYTVLTEIGAGNDIETDAAITADTIVGNSSSSSSADVDMPTGLSVSDATDGNGVTLTWTDPDDEDSTYIRILKGTDPLPVDGTTYATVAVGVEFFTDTDVEDGDVVTYQIRSYGNGATSDLTDEVTFTVGSGETSTEEDSSDDSTSTDDSSDDTGSTDESTDDTATDDSSDDLIAEDALFSDISSHWAQSVIEFMAEAGVAEGNPDGSFDPDGELNRASAAALVWRVLGSGDAPAEINADPFQDVNMSEWYAPYVADLKDLGLVAGNPDETYQPAEEINRAEFLKLALNVYLYLNPDMEDSAQEIMDSSTTSAYADLDSSAWYAETVTVATQWEFVSGSSCDEGTCFNAGDSITRAEATKILYNMFADML